LTLIRRVGMIVKLEKISIQTTKPVEAINITPQVKKVVQESSIRNGLVNVTSFHTTAGIVVNEGLPCIEEDMFFILDKLVPEDEEYHHAYYLGSYGEMGANANAHLKSILTGVNTFFPIENSKIVMSNRQTIYFLEFGGPLLRTYCVQVLGE